MCPIRQQLCDCNSKKPLTLLCTNGFAVVMANVCHSAYLLHFLSIIVVKVVAVTLSILYQTHQEAIIQVVQ